MSIVDRVRRWRPGTRVLVGAGVLVLGLVLAGAALGASSGDEGADVDVPHTGLTPTTGEDDPDIGDFGDEAAVVPHEVELPHLDTALLRPDDWADVRAATAGLDHAAREQVLDVLLYLQRRHAETVVATQEATALDVLAADELYGDEWEEVTTQILYGDEWESLLDDVRESLPPEALSWFTGLLGRLQVRHAEGLAAAEADTASAVLDGAVLGPLDDASGDASDDATFVGDDGDGDRAGDSDDADALTVVGAVSGALAALAGLATAVSGLYGVARARRLARAKRRASPPPPPPEP